MTKKILTNLLIAGCLASSAFAQPSGNDSTPLEAARELYASARYDEALAVLNGLRPDTAAASIDRRSVEQYRSLCLLALGRASEAEAAIGAVINTDPLFRPTEADASPRVRAAFSEVRQRLLPQIAASRYTAAKASFDRKEHAAAERQFRELLALLNDPEMGGRLADMKVLASGFLDLAAAAAAPPPEPLKPVPPPPVAPPQPQPQRVYGGDDASVVPPVALRQEVPPVPAGLSGQVRDNGRLEVLLDEQGRVTLATIRKPMHPFYDQLLLTAAREWRYRPATMNGVPVKFRKTLVVTVAR